MRLVPGADQNRTLALNEAAISECQFVRFVPDRQGLGLVQKLGGWTRFYPTSVGSTVRAMWAWQDTNLDSYLALGSQPSIGTITGLSNSGGSPNITTLSYSGAYAFNAGDAISVSGVVPAAYNNSYTATAATYNSLTLTGTISFQATSSGAMTTAGVVYLSDGLSEINDGARQLLTPKTQEANVTPTLATTNGSAVVTITASGSNVYSSDSVYIKTPISRNGIVLFGMYQATTIDANNFSIVATDAAGNLTPANASNTGTGSLPVFGYTNGSSVVTVTLPNHGYIVGDTFPILIPTTSASITLFGNYTVVALDVVSPSNIFSIQADNLASATTTYTMNGGNARYVYYKVPGVLPASLGYGAGNYGDGGYGYGVAPTVTSSGPALYATDWSLDNWGQILIACPVGGEIYTWDPLSGVNQAGVIPQAPTVNDGVFVAMPQRQIIAWGSTFNGIQDSLLIRWCDVQNYSSWIATLTNQAGSYRIPKGSKIVGCIQGPQQGLVWTDLAVWAMQYVGPPYVYQFNEIGNGCGLIARKAAASMNGIVYWMSQSQFFRLGGGGVEVIRCPIWDVIFQDLDTDNLDKIRIAPNSRFGEISWYYPTTASNGEISHYVKYNVNMDVWDFGELSRTAWINQSVLGPPIGAGISGNQNLIYQHETSTDADGQPLISSFQTGYYQMTEGEMKLFIDQIWPDMKWGYYGGAQDADLTITFYVTDYAHETPRVYGPFAINNQTNFVTPRFRGRFVSIKIQSADTGSFWRMGGMKYRFQQDGKF